VKIHTAKYEPDRIGGGWSFARNFTQGFPQHSFDECNIYFIPSASMVQREEVQAARDAGKKIVLRVDNAVRNSRNRNTGMTRMYDFAQWADLIVYQSDWARDYLKPFLKKDGVVIRNSVDEKIFNSKGRPNTEDVYLYSRFNRDETKGWEIARYYYSQIQQYKPEAKLYIVGQFSPELINGNFDFYMGENYKYLGVVNDPRAMADIYRQCDYLIYTYFKDACSNTLIEALMCDVSPVGYEFFREGSADEIIIEGVDKEYFYLERMIKEYKEAFDGIEL